MSDDLGTGIANLNARRQRRVRQAPTPRHPKVTDTDTATTSATAVSPAAPELEVVQPPAPQPTPRPQAPARAPAPAPAAPAPITTPATTAGQPVEMPPLDIDLDDPSALIVSPTMLNMPASIMARFDVARFKAASHTALVIDALRANHTKLPVLILERRPGAKPGDLFPWREKPGATRSEPSLPLRIRPTTGELAVMKALVDWCSASLRQLRPGAAPTNRSEMVAAALDAYLPAADD